MIPDSKVVISGIGAHCALGSSRLELWNGIVNGHSGIKPITRFDVTAFKPKIGGMVDGGDEIESDRERLLTYALKAAKEALDDADIPENSQVALLLGTSNGVRGKEIDNVSYDLASRLNIGGLLVTISTACTSSAHAMGIAADLLKQGKADVVLAGGVDILTDDVFAGFNCLGLLSSSPCAPFSNPLGTTLGEGAGFVVMEPEKSAKQRGVEPKAVFMGYGAASDAYHDTKPDPKGSGASIAIRTALTNSGITPEDVDYVNAHGTGTAANDAAEWRAILTALSAHANTIPVSSSKSFLGHAQGASGVLEAITSMYAMQNNVVPPTLNYRKPRSFSPPDPVAETRPRPHPTRINLCTNSAFGGLNTAMIIGRKDVEIHPPSLSPKELSILSYGTNFDQDHTDESIPIDELRKTDIKAKTLIGLVAKLLKQAGIKIRSAECENIGLFVGQDSISDDSNDALQKSIDERGVNHLSASAFTRLVVNYPASVCCRLFGLKGPVAAVAARPDNGMTAFCLGADNLAWRNDTDLMLIATVDTHNNSTAAAGVLLKADNPESQFRITKWSMSANSTDSFKEEFKMTGFETTITFNRTSSPFDRGLYKLVEAIENHRKAGQQFFRIKSEDDDYMELDIIIERKD